MNSIAIDCSPLIAKLVFLSAWSLIIPHLLELTAAQSRRQVLYTQGIKAYEQRDFAKAAQCWESLLELPPLLLKLPTILWRDKLYVDADENLYQLIKLYNSQHEYGHSEILVKAQLRSHKKLFPHEIYTVLLSDELGTVYNELGEYQHAADQYKESLRLFSETQGNCFLKGAILNQLALALERTGHHVEAGRLFREISATCPGFLQMHDSAK